MRDFKKPQVWEKAHQLTLRLYQSRAAFPKEELYGLTSQMRRSAISIPSNIAEGCGRNSSQELSHFLHIASDSASELEYQLLLAHDLGIIERDIYAHLENLIVEVK